METNILLLITCGCPSTGKTYFITKFKDHISTRKIVNFHLIHINYDKIVNSKLEKQIIEIDFWKESRLLIQHLISRLICYLKTKNNDVSIYDYFNEHKTSLLFQVSSLAIHSSAKEEIYLNFLSNFQQFKKNVNDKFLLCIDDNMYYESMRFKYFKIARQENCSYYCICFKIRSLEKLLKLNQNRLIENDNCFIITDTIIENMFTKFNYPNLVNWEKDFSLVLEYNENFELEIGYEKLFFDLINLACRLFSSCNQITDSLFLDDACYNNNNNKTCNVNIKHQSDLIIRRLVKQSIEKSENKKKEIAIKLNKIKNVILEKLNKKDDDLFIKLNELFNENLIVFENYLTNYFLKIKNSIYFSNLQV